MATVTETKTKKKKILVLISHGGGGHKTAGEALTQILGDSYEVEIRNVFSEVLPALDPINQITFGKASGEKLYNFFLKRHQTKMIHWMSVHGTKHMSRRRISKALERYLQKNPYPPDLIISATPFINYGLASATYKWNIPFLILPTDLDGSTFLQGFSTNTVYPNLKVALAYDDPDIRLATFKKAPIPDHQLSITGFPIRPDCLKKYTLEELSHLRKKYHLLDNHHTLTLIMGALGGNLILEHTKILASLDPALYPLPLQINICVGQNAEVGKKIEHYLLSKEGVKKGAHIFELPSGTTFHIRGFTKHIIELMALSDVIISKTGSCTVNEAIYLKKTLLLDNTGKATAKHLRWEKFNIPFVQKHHLGYAFTDSKQLLMLLPSLFKYPKIQEKPFVYPNFSENIQKLVHKMLYPIS